jgi:hypothetical protein
MSLKDNCVYRVNDADMQVVWELVKENLVLTVRSIKTFYPVAERRFLDLLNQSVTNDASIDARWEKLDQFASVILRGTNFGYWSGGRLFDLVKRTFGGSHIPQLTGNYFNIVRVLVASEASHYKEASLSFDDFQRNKLEALQLVIDYVERFKQSGDQKKFSELLVLFGTEGKLAANAVTLDPYKQYVKANREHLHPSLSVVAMLINLANDNEDLDWRAMMWEKVIAYMINYGNDGRTLFDELDSAGDIYRFARAVMILKHSVFGSILNDRFGEDLRTLPFDQIFFTERVSGIFALLLSVLIKLVPSSMAIFTLEEMQFDKTKWDQD